MSKWKPETGADMVEAWDTLWKVEHIEKFGSTQEAAKRRKNESIKGMIEWATKNPRPSPLRS